MLTSCKGVHLPLLLYFGKVLKTAGGKGDMNIFLYILTKVVYHLFFVLLLFFALLFLLVL